MVKNIIGRHILPGYECQIVKGIGIKLDENIFPLLSLNKLLEETGLRKQVFQTLKLQLIIHSSRPTDQAVTSYHKEACTT